MIARPANEPIAIIGIGCRLPGGANSAQAFWKLLRDGRSAIREVPNERWDLTTHFHPDPLRPLHQHVRHGGFVDGIDLFDPSFFGISPREAVCMDPQQRLLMEVAWQAVETAGQPLETLRGSRTAVFMGISSADYSSLLWASSEQYRIPDNEPFVLPGNTGCIAANRLSYFFDFKGPSFTVDTACSSSLVAVHLACESIWRGESTAALVGGVQALIHPGIQSSFCKAGLLAPDGQCKSFDAGANGYVRSEGAGAVLLKPLNAARSDGDPIVALIHGTAVNSDGRSNGMVAPNLRAQVACVRDAFERAGIDPAATQYVEAHGTGTRQGDPIELRALGTVLGEGRPEDQPCRIGSVKTNLGHSETAAGITGLIKAALCIQHRQLPPSLNFKSPNPAIDFAGLKLRVQTELEPFPRADEPAVVGVSSFGFGGTNAHVVLADAPKPPPPPRYGQRMPQHLLCVSARTEDALRQQAAQLVEMLQTRPNLVLDDLCATSNARRSHFVRRLICLGSQRSDLLAQLQACAAGGTTAAEAAGAVAGQASRRPGKLAFLFTGQGSQSLGMARGLYEQHPVFREAFERATALLDPLLEQPLRDVLFPAEGADPKAATFLNQTSFTQPALFVVGYALSQLWRSWGIHPDLLMGHSVGEIVAAHLAGVFDLADAIQLVAARGRLMQALPKGGGMVALIASATQVETLIESQGSGSREASELSIAAYNGPSNTVVSGPRRALDGLIKACQIEGIACHPLAVSHAFHSPAMAPMLRDFEQVLRQIHFNPPSRPLVSNVSGELAGPEIAQSDYWCDHVLSPVRFAQGMATLRAQGAVTFVELGAKPTLISMGRQCLETIDSNVSGFAWWPSLRPGCDDWQIILRSLAELHRSGQRIDWKGFHKPFPYRLMTLPGYPFQRQSYWWSRPGEGDSHASLWLGHILDSVENNTMAPRLASLESQAMGSVWLGLTALDLPGGKERRFSTKLKPCCPGDLDAHRIREQPVFPASGFIQLALQAAKAQHKPLRLIELQLDQPLKVGEAGVVLQLLSGPDGIEFHSQIVADDESGEATVWRSHGSCRHGDVDNMDQSIPVRQQPASAEPLDLEGFYAALQTFGLCYGSAFRTLTEISRLGDSAWANVKRHQQAQDWTLLDGCFQAVAATLDPQAAAGQLFLPVGLELLELSAIPLPDEFTVQVQLCSSEEPAFVVADLLLRKNEDVLGWIQGFRLRRLPRTALDWLFPQANATQETSTTLLKGPASWLAQAQWEPFLPADPSLGSSDHAAEKAPTDLIRASALPNDPFEATAELLRIAQQRTPQGSNARWLLLDTPENPALTGALDGFAKAAGLEQTQRQWLRIHLQKNACETTLPWAQINGLASKEAALAWDGQQLFRQRLRPLTPERFSMVCGSVGLLESLEPCPLINGVTPGAGELELAVEATGLNFRDVLNALGLLRAYSRQLGIDEKAQVPFGGECVGTVTAVGPGVDPALLGTRMLAALAVGSLASHVTTRAELCVPLPSTLNAVEGASVSTAFLTAAYGLQTLAGLAKGETVLIHAAAGGVGQAAVQVARHLGAKIIATASAAKQQALLEQGVEAVFDSRSLEFAEQVREHTGGRGVDVVLNSLKGEWVDASFEALAEGGRFIELGKIDIWSRSEASKRRPDVSYHPFDLLEVAAAEPQLIRGLLEQLMADLQNGTYVLMPIQVFPVEQTVEAFRLIAQARHVGKVVITNQQGASEATSACSPTPNTTSPIAADATYLITGAFGGIGLRLCRWLADQGASTLLMLSRSADQPSYEAQELLRELAQRGVKCTAVAGDLTTSEESRDKAQQRIADALGKIDPNKPLRGVFHAAGILDDALIESLDSERLSTVWGPKVRVWQHIESALNGLTTPSDKEPAQPFVVHFSSMAALLGSPGQGAYCAANGALDVLATGSFNQLSIQWGPWHGSGMAANLNERERQRLEALGIRSLDPTDALNALEIILRRKLRGSVAVLDVDWPRLAQQTPARQAALLQPLVERHAARAAAVESLSCATTVAPPPYLVVIEETPPMERQAVLVGFVQQQLAKVMGVSDPQQIDPGEPLFNMGLDSLMALELTVLLEKNLGVRLTESLVFEHPSVDELVRHFLQDVLFPDEDNIRNLSRETDQLLPAQGHDKESRSSDAASSSWDLHVADIAAMDTSELLKELRGE